MEICSSEKEALLERLGFPCYQCGRASLQDDIKMLTCEDFIDCDDVIKWYSEIWDPIPTEAIEY